MIRRPPRSTLDRSSAASDVYKRQGPRPTLGPVSARINAFEHDAMLEGALDVGRLEVVAGPDGTGSALVRLEEGCHKLALLSQAVGGSAPDVDADVTSA